MALEDMTVAQLRDLANKTHVQLGNLTLKADIIEAIEAAGVSVDEDGEPEPGGEPEAEEEPDEGYEYEQPQDEQPPPGTAEEPVVQAGGYVATEQGWVLKESLEG